jgi:hypothetical protein
MAVMAQLAGKRLPANCRYTVETTNAIFPEHIEDEGGGRFIYMRENYFQCRILSKICVGLFRPTSIQESTRSSSLRQQP